MSEIFYYGQLAGCVLIARIPDLIGRRIPFFVSVCMQLIIIIMGFLSTSYTFTTVLGFFMGFLRMSLYNSAYINICEYVHGMWKSYVCMLLLTFDLLTVILMGIYYHYISRSWLYFALIGLIMNAVAVIGVYFVPESPEYLYSYYKFEKCREVLN